MTETNHAGGDAHKVALLFITQEMLGNADVEVAMTSDLDRSVAARHLRAFADKLENKTAGEPAPEEDPPAHPLDEAWEYVERVAYMVDGDPGQELAFLSAAHNRLSGLGHLVRDGEKGAWGTTVNLLERLIANRRRADGAAESTSPEIIECARCGASEMTGCDIWQHHPLCQIDGELTNLSDDEVRKVLRLLGRNDYRVVEAGRLVGEPSNGDFPDGITF